MKVDTAIELLQPFLILLVRREIVQDDVKFLVRGLFGKDSFQEALKIRSRLGSGDFCVDLASSDIQSGEQVDRAVTFVRALLPADLILTLSKNAHERELETGLVGHIQKFLLELASASRSLAFSFRSRSRARTTASTCSSTT